MRIVESLRGSDETSINGKRKRKKRLVLEIKPLLLPRILAEYERVRNALRSLKPISSRRWSVERNRVYLLQQRLTAADQDVFPVTAELDIEAYLLCAAAAIQKSCVNEDNLKIIRIIHQFLLYAPVIFVVAYIASHTLLSRDWNLYIFFIWIIFICILYVWDFYTYQDIWDKLLICKNSYNKRLFTRQL